MDVSVYLYHSEQGAAEVLLLQFYSYRVQAWTGANAHQRVSLAMTQHPSAPVWAVITDSGPFFCGSPLTQVKCTAVSLAGSAQRSLPGDAPFPSGHGEPALRRRRKRPAGSAWRRSAVTLNTASKFRTIETEAAKLLQLLQLPLTIQRHGLGTGKFQTSVSGDGAGPIPSWWATPWRRA